MAEPHDAPSARELIESVREWIERDVAPAVSGRLQFHSRVAVNVLAMVERELEAGPVQAEAHAARLAALGAQAQCVKNKLHGGGIVREEVRSKVAREGTNAAVEDCVNATSGRHANARNDSQPTKCEEKHVAYCYYGLGPGSY